MAALKQSTTNRFSALSGCNKQPTVDWPEAEYLLVGCRSLEQLIPHRHINNISFLNIGIHKQLLQLQGGLRIELQCCLGGSVAAGFFQKVGLLLAFDIQFYIAG
jgi:hypothetical protein